MYISFFVLEFVPAIWKSNFLKKKHLLNVLIVLNVFFANPDRQRIFAEFWFNDFILFYFLSGNFLEAKIRLCIATLTFKKCIFQISVHFL